MKKYALGYYSSSFDELSVLRKDSNRDILAALRKEYPRALTAREISRKTSHSVKTIYSQINELYESGFVATPEKDEKRNKGRKRKLDLGRADRFVIEERSPLLESSFNVPLAPGGIQQPNGFKNAFHNLIDANPELNQLYE